MKKLLNILLALLMLVSICACTDQPADEGRVYHIGICNYVDDASLNQIVASITARLDELDNGRDFRFDVRVDNCNADTTVLNQIIANFLADNVDLMVAVATPVASVMKGATEENGVPVIFAAVSDPVGAGLVDSLEHPGANVSGTSDYLDTGAMLDLMFLLDPDLDKVGLLYDISQESSTAAIREAKEYLNNKGVTIIEKTGTNSTEISLAADELIASGVRTIFTPSDNTVMAAELSIYEKIAQAGIRHYAGADSFALNSAFLGYGVDYANLGVNTADMIYEALVSGADLSSLAVRTFDNGTATINTDTCRVLGLNYDDVAALFGPHCTKVVPIETAEEFQ